MLIIKNLNDESVNISAQIDNLKDSVKKKIEDMIKRNKTRMNFRDRYAEVLQKYNDGSISLDDVFKKLVELSKELNEEMTFQCEMIYEHHEERSRL